MEGILRFKIGWACQQKQLALTVHGFTCIFGRAYYRKNICVWNLAGLFSVGGGGGLLSEFYGTLLYENTSQGNDLRF